MEENKNIEESSKTEDERLKEEKTISIPENPVDPAASTLNLTALNPQPSDMEVHKHPHHVTHKKQWGEYLLEFFMLFLAVFLGFVAENIRESSVEHEREKEYAKALYDEFYADSISVTNKLNSRLEKEKDCNWLAAYIKDSSLTSLPKEFYPAYTTVFYLINSYTFEPKDGVLSQLKSSGSLRYFKNAALQKLFGDMSVCISNVRYRNEQEYQFFASPIKSFLLEHYDFGWVNALRKPGETSYNIDLINNYRKGDTLINANILHPATFDRSVAINMILFYKTMLVSSRTLQINDYIKSNNRILQMLRDNYAPGKE